MRGRDSKQPSIFVHATVDSFVPESHPLRAVKELTELALVGLSQQIGRRYSKRGRPSIPPERLLKSQLLMALYGISSERSFCEQLRYNMLFKWFVGLELDEEPFVATVFTKNRDRFMDMDIGKKLFDAVVLQASEGGLLSNEHFSVDGSLIEAAASMKSFRPKDEDDNDGDGNGWADFAGKRRSNATHESKTDPDCRIAKKGPGKEAKLSFHLNVLSENRNGLILNLHSTIATGMAERDGAIALLDSSVAPRKSRATLAADKGYDARDFFDAIVERDIRPHIAIQHNRKEPLYDKRTTTSRGYQLSQIYRRKVEGIIGWLKHPGRIKRVRLRGLKRVNHLTYFAGAAHNLLRIVNLTRGDTRPTTS